MAQISMGLHEILELHEVLNFKTVCMVKSKLIQGLVFDEDLKALLEKDAQQSFKAVRDLQNLMDAGTNPIIGLTGVQH